MALTKRFTTLSHVTPDLPESLALPQASSILMAFTVDPLHVKFMCVWQSLVNAGSPTLLVLDLYPCLRVMQIDTEVGPRNGLHPASGDQNRSILEPASTFHIEVAEVPAGLIHNKALKDSKVTICGPHVVTQHMQGAAQMGVLGGIYRVLLSSWYVAPEELAVHPSCQRAPVFTHGNFLLT